MKKFFKIGCLSTIGFFGAIFLYFLFEPKSCREQRIQSIQRDIDSAQYFVSEVPRRMARVRKQLPLLAADSIPHPFPPGNIDWSITLQTSEDEVFQFTDTSFLNSPPLRYGPWLTNYFETIENAYDTTRVRNTRDEISHGRIIMNMKYLMVYVPLYHMQPKVLDKSTFQPGYFDGWMIYVDFESGKPLGYARFQSFSTLHNVESDRIGVGVGPISIPLINTTNVQEELTKDFRTEFFRKTDSTFAAFKKN